MSTTAVPQAVDKPEIGWTSGLGLALTFATSMPLWIGALQEDLSPLGTTPAFWLWATVAAGVGTVAIRMLQAATVKWAAWDIANPSKGLATYLGFGLGTLMELPAFLAELDEQTKPLGVDPGTWVTAGLVLTGVTGAGRVLQQMISKYNAHRGKPQPVEPTPTEPGGTERPPPVEPGPPEIG